eukprot:gene7090-194_t
MGEKEGRSPLDSSPPAKPVAPVLGVSSERGQGVPQVEAPGVLGGLLALLGGSGSGCRGPALPGVLGNALGTSFDGQGAGCGLGCAQDCCLDQ